MKIKEIMEKWGHEGDPLSSWAESDVFDEYVEDILNEFDTLDASNITKTLKTSGVVTDEDLQSLIKEDNYLYYNFPEKETHPIEEVIEVSKNYLNEHHVLQNAKQFTKFSDRISEAVNLLCLAIATNNIGPYETYQKTHSRKRRDD